MDRPIKGRTLGAAPQVYTIKSGDTLFRIARCHLGDGNLWPLIYRYAGNAAAIERRQAQLGERTRRNFGLYGPDWIFVGTEINLPPGGAHV